MDLGLAHRTAVVLGESASAQACRRTLASEGVSLLGLDALERADIVVAFGTRRRGSDLVSATVEDLYGAWDGVVRAITAYRRALPHMQEQRWGRLVWVGTASSRSLDADHDDLDLIATLGM